MFKLQEGVYLSPTAAGAYYLAANQKKDASRQFLMSLMTGDESPLLNEAALARWSHAQPDEDISELIYRLQELGLIQGENTPHHPPAGSLEDVLPPLLVQLSSNEKALLSDAQGLYLATAGFPHEAAEELSALSADLADLHTRHKGLLEGNLGFSTSNWGLIDASGNSQLGLWPLYIGEYRFVLVIAGMPQLNQAQFTDLVWLLSRRYGTNSSTLEKF
ncbi:MAG: hypothetical protein HOP04_00065 [Methylophilaceae bacterium]|nr:hypothetical protein [Methylophilaceae bacterium]